MIEHDPVAATAVAKKAKARKKPGPKPKAKPPKEEPYFKIPAAQVYTKALARQNLRLAHWRAESTYTPPGHPALGHIRASMQECLRLLDNLKGRTSAANESPEDVAEKMLSTSVRKLEDRVHYYQGEAGMVMGGGEGTLGMDAAASEGNYLLVALKARDSVSLKGLQEYDKKLAEMSIKA